MSEVDSSVLLLERGTLRLVLEKISSMDYGEENTYSTLVGAQWSIEAHKRFRSRVEATLAFRVRCEMPVGKKCNTSISFRMCPLGEVDTIQKNRCFVIKSSGLYGFGDFCDTRSINRRFGRSCSVMLEVNIEAKQEQPRVLYGLWDTLAEHPSLSDFKIKVTGGEFNVHKNILMARSSYFSRMLIANMIESQTNTVTVPESAIIMERILRFIYDGTYEVQHLDSEMLVAADFYQIPELKDRCASRLKTMLNVANACQLLELADMHDVPQLRKAAIDFIVINLHAFIDTAEYVKLSEYLRDAVIQRRREVSE